MSDSIVKAPATELPLQNFSRKPFNVSAVQMTLENIQEVAEWCGGEVREKAANEKYPATKYIRVPVKRPMNHRQSLAYPGDYVSFNGKGFKVYTKDAFEANFDLENE